MSSFPILRNPRGELDFHSAVPEKGLFEHLQECITTRKDILCSPVSFHLVRKRLGKFAKDLPKKADVDFDSADNTMQFNAWNSIEFVDRKTRRMFVEKLAEHCQALEGSLGKFAPKKMRPRLQATITTIVRACCL